MKRKLKWIGVSLVVLVLGFGTALLLWPRDRITAESWQKIRIGMTEDEVAEILDNPGMTDEEALAQYVALEKELGRPPFENEGPRMEEPKEPPRHLVTGSRIWSGHRGIIFVEFDQENRVCCKEFQGGRWINAGVLDRLRDWLGW
jgi:hypothetical protein